MSTLAADSARRRVAAYAALQGLSLDGHQIEQLLTHLTLLQKWNQVYNLTALRDPELMLQQHLLDSLSLIAPLQRHLGSSRNGARALDVGSGAGFPGLTLAIAMPDIEVICVDSVGKKAGFIRQVAGELQLGNVRAEHARIEGLPPLQCDVITSRAFASLIDFTALSRCHLTPDGCWVAMKGQLPEAELEALPADIDVFHVEQLSVAGLNADRCLIWMRPAG